MTSTTPHFEHRSHDGMVENLWGMLAEVQDLNARGLRRIEKLVTELANARNLEAFKAFAESWPEFCAQTLRTLPPGLVTAEKDFPQWMGDDPTLQCLWFLSNILRRLWIGDEYGVATAELILMYQPETKCPGPLRLDWRQGRFVYRPATELQTALMVLAEAGERRTVCRNRDCKSPLFLGDRLDEAYCSKSCFATSRQISKRNWWRENGAAWRRKQARAKKK